jgi:hypothetical protein
VDEQIEHLRFDLNEVGAAAQLAPIRIECAVAEEKLHQADSGYRVNTLASPTSRENRQFPNE